MPKSVAPGARRENNKHTVAPQRRSPEVGAVLPSAREHLLAGFLTEAELAEELGVCRKTIKRWRLIHRDAPAVTRIGRRLYYHRAAVERWLASREAAS